LLLPSRAFAETRVCLLDEGVRVAREQSGALITGSCNASLEQQVLRGEHLAFQVSVDTDAPLSGLRLTIEGEQAGLNFQRFLEHFVRVSRRSRTGDSHESLFFLAPARPPGPEDLGWLPDALIPVEQAPRWLPYPAQVEPGRAVVFFVEAFIPYGIDPGRRSLRVRVESDQGLLATSTLELEISAVELPYRAARAHIFYEQDTLRHGFTPFEPVEKRLVQLAHAHGLDTVTQIAEPADVERLRGSFDGSWFSESQGYTGPGAGVPTSLAPVGMYGILGEPRVAQVANIRALREAIPRSVEDVFLYAIDEQCDNPRGRLWKALLEREQLALVVGHTCHEPPATQAVDLVMSPAQAFSPVAAAEARALGKKVWIYNGQLPFAGALGLDVPLTSLTANGWIASIHDVDRWFYWESIFWNDGNRGGKGPSDVFSNVETFHNSAGDVALYDGLLFYPGRLAASLGPHDLGVDGVVPSLRLKALRRGLEDAGLLELAARKDVPATLSVANALLSRTLDEVGAHEATAMDLRAESFAASRKRLRVIIESQMPAAGRAEGLPTLRLEKLKQLKRKARSEAVFSPVFVAVVLPLALFALGALVVLLHESWRAARRR
jgi:hypothetical protein